jgi:hypothetical protein
LRLVKMNPAAEDRLPVAVEDVLPAVGVEEHGAARAVEEGDRS